MSAESKKPEAKSPEAKGSESKFLHNLGNAFLGALDDVRQKVVEEGWTGKTQTPTQQLDTKYSDFVGWLYGGGQKPEPPKNIQEGLGTDRQPQADTTAAWVGRGAANLEAQPENGLQAAYSAFVDRCERSGIDPNDRGVSDSFWAGHAHGGSTLDWVNGASRSAQTPAMETPQRDEGQGLEL